MVRVRHGISIHAPHEGERHVTRDKSLTIRALFQSTLPTRGSDYGHIYRHAIAAGISIHAPHEGERRAGALSPSRVGTHFNPRSPRGGATKEFYICPREDFISIHAPHEGERLFCPPKYAIAPNFNPRSPRGGATGGEHLSLLAAPFQSTLPTRGSDAQRFTS